MKIVLAHDYLNSWGGGERVLVLFKEMYKDADVVAITHDHEKVKEHIDFPVITSFLQRLPGGIGIRYHKWFLSLMPMAVESLDMTSYDLILSDSSGFIKGVITRKDAVHVCYLHTTTRYLTTDGNYIRDNVPSFVRWIVPMVKGYLTRKDLQGAARPTVIIANSKETAARCKKFYKRTPEEVIFPPVDTRVFYRKDSDKVKEFYLAAGRLAPYKRFDLCIRACAELGRKLVVIGTGPEEESLKALAKELQADVEFRGKVSDEEFRAAYASCKAFLFPPLEDAGMTPLEAMSCGAPVIAYGKGGALESVNDGVTGVFFANQTVEEFVTAIKKFEGMKFDTKAIIAHAETFSADSFKKKIKAVVDEALAARK